LVLRFTNETGIRNQIPVIVESSDSLFFTREMTEIMHAPWHRFYFLDIEDPPIEMLELRLFEIFSKEQITEIYSLIGGNLAEWHKICKRFIMEENFSFEEWKKNFLKENERTYNQFIYRLNMAKVSPVAGELLDNNTIDSEMHQFAKLIAILNGELHTGTMFADSL